MATMKDVYARLVRSEGMWDGMMSVTYIGQHGVYDVLQTAPVKQGRFVETIKVA